MKNLSCTHCFIIGFFVAMALSQSILPSLFFAIILMLFWANITLPILMALFIDTVFIHERVFSNMYGFAFTGAVIILILTLLPLRKFLKF